MPAQELPARPNLDQYKKQAKELVKAAKAGDARAFALMREHHPRLKKRRTTNCVAPNSRWPTRSSSSRAGMDSRVGRSSRSTSKHDHQRAAHQGSGRARRRRSSTETSRRSTRCWREHGDMLRKGPVRRRGGAASRRTMRRAMPAPSSRRNTTSRAGISLLPSARR